MEIARQYNINNLDKGYWWPVEVARMNPETEGYDCVVTDETDMQKYWRVHRKILLILYTGIDYTEKIIIQRKLLYRIDYTFSCTIV